jgi:Tfp pilus assembly protein PilZ
MENFMSDENELIEEKPDHRFKARIAIFNGPEQTKPISNYSVNTSTGGVFIETVNILPVDTSLIVKFKLPSDDSIISCKARVAWINEAGHLRIFSLPLGMSLRFLDLSLINMNIIRDYLKKVTLRRPDEIFSSRTPHEQPLTPF